MAGSFGPLAELCVSGDVEIHIDRTFALDDVAQALSYVGEGKALGKVVVEVAAGRSNRPQAESEEQAS